MSLTTNSNHPYQQAIQALAAYFAAPENDSNGFTYLRGYVAMLGGMPIARSKIDIVLNVVRWDADVFNELAETARELDEPMITVLWHVFNQMGVLYRHDHSENQESEE